MFLSSDETNVRINLDAGKCESVSETFDAVEGVKGKTTMLCKGVVMFICGHDTT